MGDAPNLAARLMGRAAEGEIVSGDLLHGTFPGQFDWTALQPFTVKGKRARWGRSWSGGWSSATSAELTTSRTTVGRS